MSWTEKASSENISDCEEHLSRDNCSVFDFLIDAEKKICEAEKEIEHGKVINARESLNQIKNKYGFII